MNVEEQAIKFFLINVQLNRSQLGALITTLPSAHMSVRVYDGVSTDNGAVVDVIFHSSWADGWRQREFAEMCNSILIILLLIDGACAGWVVNFHSGSLIVSSTPTQ